MTATTPSEVRDTVKSVFNIFARSAHLWAKSAFGEDVANDRIQRGHRFLEEALELAQSIGVTKEDATVLVDYVFSRPVGAPPQEVGGVMVTLGTLCVPCDIDLGSAAMTELGRVQVKIDQIRAKQATKPFGSPLPGT